MNEVYDALLEEESVPADPTELLPVTGLREDSYEGATLLENKVSISELQSGRIQREKLLEAGFVFINMGEEKPLLSAEVQTDCGAFAPGKKALFTQPELEATRAQQTKDSIEGDSQVTNYEVVREQMLTFLLDSLIEHQGRQSKTNRMFREAQALILSTGNEHEIASLGDLFTREIEKERQTGSSNLQFIMQECVAGIDIMHVGDIPIDVFPSRFSALDGKPSPFIDSGFHFGFNPDVTMYPRDHAKTRRLNMMNVHLLSRGVNETGVSRNGSHDQTYITADEFVQMTNPSSPAEPVAYDDKVALVAARLLNRTAN